MTSDFKDPRKYFEEAPNLQTTMVRVSQLNDNARALFLDQVKDIFYHSSSVKTFKSSEHKAEFFQRWCGDY